MKESLCKVPSLDEAAEVVAIDCQDHTFEFKDLLKDREELRSGHKKNVLGQQDPVGLGGPAIVLAPLPMRSKWSPTKNACLAAPEVHQVPKVARRLLQARSVPKLAVKALPKEEMAAGPKELKHDI